LGSGAVVIVVEHRHQAAAQVPLEVIGANARAETVKDRRMSRSTV
jgi:hypothetical protein